MGNLASDILANSPVTRYNEMMDKRQKMMDRINGAQLKRTALLADIATSKMIDRLESVNALKTYSQDLQTSLDRATALQTRIGSLQGLAKQLSDPLSLKAGIERSQTLGTSPGLKGLAATLYSKSSLGLANPSGFGTRFTDALNVSTYPALDSAKRLQSLNLSGANRVLRGYSNSFDKLSSPGGMVGVDFAISLSQKRPKLSEYKFEIFEQILEEAEAFHEEYGGTEIEETAQEFLDTVPAAAEQVTNSEYLVTLTLRQRRILSGYFAFLIFLIFASIAIYGYHHVSEAMQLLTFVGINIPTVSATTGAYKGSMIFLEKYATTNEDEEEPEAR